VFLSLNRFEVFRLALNDRELARSSKTHGYLARHMGDGAGHKGHLPRPTRSRQYGTPNLRGSRGCPSSRYPQLFELFKRSYGPWRAGARCRPQRRHRSANPTEE
jgi:hypothetical protein